MASSVISQTNDIAAERLMNDTEVARFLNLSTACIRKWRLTGEGPVHVRLGNRIRYKRESVLHFIDSCPAGGAGRRIGA
jgi:predicted DNA-binding transcriptional regulator AlpA